MRLTPTPLRLRRILSPVVVLLLPVVAAAQSDTATTREIAPGVTLRRVVREGPVVMHVVAVDLRRPDLRVGVTRACDRVHGRERPSAIARRLRSEGVDVLAVLNAGFFDLEGGTGASETNVVVDGQIAKAVSVTESPFDVFDNVHSQFAMTDRGRPAIDRFALQGTVRTPRDRWRLGAINGRPALGEVALYTTRVIPRFPVNAATASVPLERMRRSGDTTVYRVRSSTPDSTADTTGASAVLVGAGNAAPGVARLRAGERLTVVARFTPDRGRLNALVGGWPRIVRAGVNIAPGADSVEGTFPRFSANRNPRSVVGFSRDSTTLYLVSIDGRSAASVGMSLDELARAMIELGLHDALNLDGGGSTALVVGDTVVNRPSDQAGERPVGDVIVVSRHGQGQPAQVRAFPSRAAIASCVVGGNRDPDRATP